MPFHDAWNVFWQGFCRAPSKVLSWPWYAWRVALTNLQWACSSVNAGLRHFDRLAAALLQLGASCPSLREPLLAVCKHGSKSESGPGLKRSQSLLALEGRRFRSFGFRISKPASMWRQASVHGALSRESEDSCNMQEMLCKNDKHSSISRTIGFHFGTFSPHGSWEPAARHPKEWFQQSKGRNGRQSSGSSKMASP